MDHTEQKASWKEWGSTEPPGHTEVPRVRALINLPASQAPHQVFSHSHFIKKLWPTMNGSFRSLAGSYPKKSYQAGQSTIPGKNSQAMPKAKD